MNKFGAFLLAMFSVSAFADPTVFNMELGKTTEQEVKNMYSLEKDGINKYSRGNQYYVDVKELELDDLRSTLVIFDEKGILVAVIATIDETGPMGNKKFQHLLKLLSAKYKLVKKETPFVGNQFAKFKDGDSIINLDAPHLGGFKISLEYLRNDFLNSYKRIKAEDKKQKEKTESSVL